MSTNREIIAKVRKSVQEKDADSSFINKYFYSKIKEHSKWLIRREISAGRIYRSKSLFQLAPCIPVVKASKISDWCPIKTNCSVFRTCDKIDDLWEDDYGPVISFVSSIDGSTHFHLLSAKDYQRKKDNPYTKWGKDKYAFYADGYIWWENEAPKKVNVNGLFEYDIRNKYHCNKTESKDCILFLDEQFIVPSWIEAELVDKVTTQILGGPKRLPADNQIDKNEIRQGQ